MPHTDKYSMLRLVVVVFGNRYL